MARTNLNVWQSLRTVFSPWRAVRRDAAGAQPMNLAAAKDLLDFGVAVDNHSAMKNTALFAGIRIISENIAALPRTVRKYTDRGWIDAPEHPAYKLIAIRPNSYTNSFTFWATITTWVKGWGNAYALIRRKVNGEPYELHQIHPSWVTITMVNGHKWYRITCGDPNLQFLNGTYSDEDILHFMEVSLDGIKGVNPIIYNAAALGKSIATEKFAAEFYRKGGNIRAVMEAEGHMTDEEYKTFMKHMKHSMGNYDTPLLEYGIKYKPLAIDPIAAQLVQSEILSIQDVCRIVNAPPHMLAELSHATFSNIEHQTIQFVQYSLRPVAKRLETELESKLFFDGDEYDVKFILDGLLRGDTASRAKYYHNAILDGYMTPNEVRELEGLPRADGLDVFLKPSNEDVVGEKDPEDNNSN